MNMDASKFEPYLTYNEAGEITGLKKDAPVSLKIEFTQWFDEYKNKQRLNQTYHNE